MKQKRRKSCIKAIALGVIAFVCLGCASITAFASNSQQNVGNKIESRWNVDAGVSIEGNVDVPLAAKQGYRYGKEINESDLEPWEKNGLKISSETEAGYAYYSNIIDINGFTKNDRIIEVLPLTSLRGSSDFSSFKVILTDADDESNWLSVSFSAVSLKYSVGSTKIVVETSSGAKGGKKWGYESSEMDSATEIHTGGFYNTVKPLTGKTVEEMAAVPYGIYYDVETNIIYSRHREGGLAYLFDLDDESQTGIGKAWSGFTNNRVKLSLKLGSFSSAPASLLVLNVANNGMNGSDFVDNVGPSYLVHLPNGQVPNGLVGKAYKFFPAEFYDFYDGMLNYQVSIKGPTDNEYSLANTNSFVPSIAGTYKLFYSAIDNSGNKSGVIFDVEVYNALPSIEIQVENFDANIIVGEKFRIPQIFAEGGSGELVLTTKVIRVSDNKIISIQNNEFIPLFSGEYDIVFSITDYLNNVATETITIVATASKQPVIKSELVMYEKFVDGVTIELPSVNAFDYDTLPGQVLNAKTEITVKGTGDKSNYSELLSSHLFTPTKEKFGDKVSIEYKVYCAGYEQNAISLPSYEIDIINLEEIEEFFSIDNSKVLIEANKKTDGEKFVKMSALKAGTIEATFINPLMADNFEFLFAVSENEKNFDSIKLVLTDFFDSRIRLELTIEEWNTDNTYVYYQGQKRSMSGGFGTDAPLLLKYMANKGLADYTGEVLFNLSDFSGFPSGRVWTTIIIENASADAAIQLKTIGTQTLGARYNSKGKVPYTDVIAPVLQLNEAVPLDIKLGNTVNIPMVSVYDVFKPYLETNYSVTAPNGTILIEKKKLVEGESFVVSSYGIYTITYSAYDGENEGTMQVSIIVSDNTIPRIFYNGKTEIEARTGEVLKAKKLEAYDSYDGNVPVYVYMIDSAGKMIEITNTMSYKFLSKGKHILRYYAYDANYNYDIKDIVIWVS